MRKPKTYFAECEGELYVQVRAVMSPLIPHIDGLPMATFKGDKHTYLPVDVAIDWCRREMAHHSGEKYQVMIEVMERAKAQVAKSDAK